MGKKQKRYSADIKARVALEAMRSQKTVAQIASEYQVALSRNERIRHKNQYREFGTIFQA